MNFRRRRKRAGALVLALALCMGLAVPMAYAEGVRYNMGDMVTQGSGPDCKRYPVLPKTGQEPGGNCGNGSVSLAKLSKQEIIDLLNSAPITMPEDVFVTMPSCTAPYAAGKVRTEVLDAAAARLSALRRIAGLPAVTADPSLCEQAQYGAVILGKLGTLNHHPAKPSGMDESFYKKAYSAASSSNLYAGLSLLSTPDGFMDDSGTGSIDRLGHRRWQLNPALGKAGFGYVENGGGWYMPYYQYCLDNGIITSSQAILCRLNEGGTR